MRRVRWLLVLTFLVALGGLRGVAVPGVAAAGTWLPAGALGQNRYNHTATPLPDGSVLVAGGVADGRTLASAERYDPATNRWSPTVLLAVARAYHTATALLDGRVLVVGGGDYGAGSAFGPGVFLASAEIYDPARGVWVAAAPMATPRIVHTATLLRDGRVLVVGGRSALGADSEATAELYDPATDSWHATPPLSVGHARHSAIVLADGQVLIIAGYPTADPLTPGRVVERYDPGSDRWRRVASLLVWRGSNAAALLNDGRVIVAGGAEVSNARTAERYDPLADRWEGAGSPGRLAEPGTATRLPSGRVLMVGGFSYGTSGTQGLAALYDPQTDDWAALPNMRTSRGWHTATPLSDGRVLIAGGGADPTAELYLDEGAAQRCFPETGKCLRGRFLDRWLASGALAVNGYPLTDERIETLEDGHPYLVQYFERVRLEYHPEVADPRYQVQLGQFGRAIHPADPAATRVPGATYFPETGHNLSGGFQDYWTAHGGLDQFGLPLTEVFRERLEDGQEYEVQYFERARFEYHPENRPPFDILLGQFGRRVMAQRGIQP